MEENIRNIYSEIYGLLELLGDNYKKKLPSKLLKHISEVKNPKYQPNYNLTDNIVLKRETKGVIALLKLIIGVNQK